MLYILTTRLNQIKNLRHNHHYQSIFIMKKFLSLAVALTSVVISLMAQNDSSLKIYSGVKDTLYTSRTTVVGVADPGAVVKVNDIPVHVYKTGSFGTELQLKPGNNKVSVVSSSNGRVATLERNIFYNDNKSGAATETKEPETQYFTNPLYVMTTPGAYLQYGNGDDRLGGSKMGFIDPDIPLKVVGEAGSLYCVRLAVNRVAYIPKDYTVPTNLIPRVVNTGSWSVVNNGDADRVVVSLPMRLPYQYSTSIQPQSITIDLFGATDNSNWITQRSAMLGIVDFVDFQQVSEDIYRIIIRLKDKYQWGYTVGYENDNLVIDVRHRPESLSLKNLTIGLDAGHGGEYPGAISPSGIKEKDVNLDIVLRIRDLLEKKGAKVVLTREGDTGPSMAERKRIWRDGKVDLAVSVHNNSGGSALSSPGTAVLYKHLSNRPLAEAMLNRLLETGLPLFGLVQNFNFSLNGPTDCPNVLIEGMFMSSLAEEEKLADAEFRQLVAVKIVAAIEDYLKSAESK